MQEIKYGKIKIDLFIDEEKFETNWRTSRYLTETNREFSQKGIFNESNVPCKDKFYYEDFNTIFSFNHLLSTMSIENYAQEVILRIKTVRKWVNQCKRRNGCSVYKEEIK